MKDIDKIIEKYFEGETSLAEEQLLRDYFCQPDIKEEHKAYAPMFQFFSTERDSLPEEKTVEKRRRISLPAWISIAASIALLIGVYTLIYTPLENRATKSSVYIDGERITDINTINSEALNSIENISDMNEDIISTQINILDSFTE